MMYSKKFTLKIDISARAGLIVALCVFATPLVHNAAAEALTYNKDAAPIFFEHCVACHRPDQVAPMSLMTYTEARPWAKSIAKAVGTGKMPPWSGESDRHTWSNDISLNQAEIDTIVRWVEQGAREGAPQDLPVQPVFSDTWTLGQPDYIITLDEVAIPADGEDLFPKQYVTIDIDKTQWVRAIEFLPGDRRVAHHSQTTFAGVDGEFATGGATKVGIFGIWTAGMPPYVFPEGMGRVISAGTRILVDSHYHPFGEATTDQTRIGLYFGKGELKKEVATMMAVNTGLRIPAGEPAHTELAFHKFDRDMQIVAFSPHLHVRGKAMRYELLYPDGKTETLLNVPKYDFNWQWLYYPTKPIDVPAGSRLNVTAVWDNSAANPANPDPTQEIIYRGNTFNEMFVGFFEAIEKHGVYHHPLSTRDKIVSLLQDHDSGDTYYFGGFLPFGIYVPKEGEGWLYLAQGPIMFSISLDDFTWDDNRLLVNTQLPTPEASATTTILEGELDESGRLKATLRYGIDSARPLTVPVIGQTLAMLDAKASSQAGAR